jgi:hypothetical protein
MTNATTPELLARERVLQTLSVELEIWEGCEGEEEYVAALHDAFDALCHRWELRLR